MTAGLGFRVSYFGFDIAMLFPFEEMVIEAFNMRSSIIFQIGNAKK